MKRIEILWNDAAYENCEYTVEELQVLKPVPRSHIGYLLEETEDYIRLAACINHWSEINNGEDTFEGAIVVPRGIIERINYLDD